METLKIFIIIPPGLENLAQHELIEKWNIHFNSILLPELKVSDGGIQGDFPRDIALSLNALLKIPTRILLRLDEFKCRDFPKLYNKFIKINWNQYLLGKIPKLKTTTAKSRLINTKKMDESIEKAIAEYFIKQEPSKKLKELGAINDGPTIYTRVVDDHCTISLDLSGERLQKRGYRKNIGEAPLRENLAAAMAYSMKNTDRILIDPMCGSGTLLIEAYNFYKPIYNDYAFIHCARFKNFKWPDFKNPYPLGLFRKYIGYDLDAKVIEAAMANSQNAETEAIQFAQIDLFSDHSLLEPIEPVIISNPPYGIRLSKNEKLQNFLQKIANRIIEKFDPYDIGLLLPTKDGIHLPAPFKIKEQFRNGGINVKFWTYLS